MDRDTPAWALVEGGEVRAARNAGLRVPWWSFTKTVIAATVLRLAELGEIDLDSEVPGAGASYWRVLGHTSGLPDYGGVPAYHQAVEDGDPPWPFDRVLEEVRRFGRPVPAWSYSNIGYGYLVQYLARRRGSLGAALAGLVLEPLGVRDARLAVEPGDLAEVQMGTNRGYHPGWVYHGLLTGPVSSAALWLERLGSGGLLGAGSLDAMKRSTDLPHYIRAPWSSTSYGLGVMTPCLKDGVPVFGHTGGGPGSGVAVYRRDDLGLTAAVFCLDGEGPGPEFLAAGLLSAD